MEKILSNIEKYILYVIVFLTPFFVLSISPNPFVVPKLALLTLGVALILLVRAIRVISTGKLEFSVGNFDLPVLLLGVAYLLSAIFRTPNKMEAYLLPGTATIFLVGALLYFVINQLKEADKEKVSMLLFGSAAVFSVMVFLSFSGLLAKIPQLPAYMKANGFTPEGGYLPAAIFLGILLPMGLGLFFSQKENTRKVLLGAANGAVIVGLALSIYNILPGRPFSPRFPSFNTSWFVAIDTLKESPLFGAGPGNYLTAFNRFRPLAYNQTDLWAVKFTTARGQYLTTLTEAGLLGAAATILLLWSLYNTMKKDYKEKKLVNWGFAASATSISLVLLAVALFFLPATLLLIMVFFVLLSLSSKVRHTALNLTTQGSGDVHGMSTQAVASRFPALLVTLPVIIVVALFLYRGQRVLAAEYKFQSALNALGRNDATATYDTMREAITLNPRVDRYHATFSRVNLALANAIAQKAATPGADGKPQAISDQDRQNITTLIQQSIQEGKATVALNPLRAGNWEILGQVYRAIIPLAQGADQFTVQTYRQAVALDPFNPNLRIALGGAHYARKDYETAARVFEQAAAAKPDHANAHYNFAIALRESNSLDRAISEMTLVLSLITNKDSQDYQVAKKALEDMQAKKKAETPATGENLTSPTEGTTGPALEPPVNLPEGSEPPAAPISPTPSATVSPSVTPEVTPTVTVTPAP